MLTHIVDKSNTLNNTIQIKPNEALRPSNHLWVVWHLQNAANNNRHYEEVKKGQMVRIMINKENKFDKGHMPSWTSETYKVIGIDTNNFILDHPTKRKVILRH